MRRSFISPWNIVQVVSSSTYFRRRDSSVKKSNKTSTSHALTPVFSARFYIAQILLALEHLHKNDIVYRE